MTKPKIYPRKDWNAVPSRGGLYYPDPLSKSYYRGTLHHDASAAPRSFGEALAIVKSHQGQHMSGGWSDIGYHYLIAPGGQIIEGRPIEMQGAHTLNDAGGSENGGNVGICIMGQLHLHPTTVAQVESAKSLWAWVCKFLDLNPDRLKGHQDYMATQCPGSAYKEIPGIRSFAKAALAGTQPAPTPKPTLFVDGKKVGELLIVDGVSYAPIRDVGNALGLKVSWDDVKKQASLAK